MTVSPDKVANSSGESNDTDGNGSGGSGTQRRSIGRSFDHDWGGKQKPGAVERTARGSLEARTELGKNTGNQGRVASVIDSELDIDRAVGRSPARGPSARYDCNC